MLHLHLNHVKDRLAVFLDTYIRVITALYKVLDSLRGSKTIFIYY